MTKTYDLIVIGAGPAGMAAAIEAAGCGLTVLALDEGDAPGGQIYRGVERVAAERTEDFALLGPDYRHGLDLVKAFHAAAVDYQPGATVWRIDKGGLVAASDGRHSRLYQGKHLLIASGAMERAVPLPGWTLPGVMTAGAAQILLKSSGVVPSGRVVLAGGGPLLLLVAGQLQAAGCHIAGIVETTTSSDYRRSLRHLPQAALAGDYLLKGAKMARDLKWAGLERYDGCRNLAVTGQDRAEGLAFTSLGARLHLQADVILLHDGVMPNLQLCRQVGCALVWDQRQRSWRPRLDDWGATSLERVFVAGDGGSIDGARAAEASGRLAALEIARRQERISAAERDAQAKPWRWQRFRHRAIRPFLETLFRPQGAFLSPPDDATLVCRCEEVSVGQVREAVALGCLGPNQVKSFTRAGMGPCQGRSCGTTVAGIIAKARGLSMEQVGHYRIRAPIKPISLGELAALGEEEELDRL